MSLFGIANTRGHYARLVASTDFFHFWRVLTYFRFVR